MPFWTPKLGYHSPVNYAEAAADAHASNIEARQIAPKVFTDVGNLTFNAPTGCAASTDTAPDGSYIIEPNGLGYVWVNGVPKVVGLVRSAPSDVGFGDYGPPMQYAYPSSLDFSIAANGFNLMPGLGL